MRRMPATAGSGNALWEKDRSVPRALRERKEDRRGAVPCVRVLHVLRERKEGRQEKGRSVLQEQCGLRESRQRASARQQEQ